MDLVQAIQSGKSVIGKKIQVKNASSYYPMYEITKVITTHQPIMVKIKPLGPSMNISCKHPFAAHTFNLIEEEKSA